LNKNEKRFVNFGLRFKAACDDAGLNQKQVAELIGVSKTTVNGYATGAQLPGGEVLLMIQSALNVSLDWLLSGRKETEKNAEFTPPGHGLLRLPRGDPRPLTGDEADLLEQTLTVLRGQGEAASLGEALAGSIRAMHKSVSIINQHGSEETTGRRGGTNAG